MSRKAKKVFKKLRKKNPELEITISTNSFGSTDNIIAYSANYRLRTFYIQTLKFNIYEYKPFPADLMRVFPDYTRFSKAAQLEKKSPPFLSLHAKALVVDDRIAFIGSYNMDPRSGNLNTEAGLLIEDMSVAKMLKAQIRVDCRPENSWVIGSKKRPLQLNSMNALFEGISGIGPIDLWPIRNTSSFELIPGKSPLLPDDPLFHTHYTDAGSFPDAADDVQMKEFATRIYKAVGAVVTPLF